MKYSIAVVLLISLLLIACKDKQASTKEVLKTEDKETKATNPSTKNKNKTILCFGNSLTAGYGLDEQYAWPSLLQDTLDVLNKKYEVINAGLSGETTSGGLNRIDWVLNQEVDVFILELGANDMLRGLDVKMTETNLRKILNTVKLKNPDVSIVLAGMLAPPSMGDLYESAFNGIFPKLAKEFDSALIPFFLENVAGDKALNLPDDKHPNKEGQKIVLQNVMKSLMPLIND